MKIIFYYFVDLNPNIMIFEFNNVLATAKAGAILDLSKQK
jgi:hypothetical protein